jgi:hypothetical protein
MRMRMRIGAWAVFGRENEHLFLRHIVGFIPRTRFEEGEGEGEELLRQEMAKNHVALEEAQGVRALDQSSIDTVQAQQAQLQARIDALEQAQGLRRKADSERGFPDTVERGV